MIYRVTVFRDLCSQYISWPALKEFLQSAEGGLLTVIEEPSRKEAIIRYQKGISILTFPHVPWFRSVVWNTDTNRPLCVSPPKASIPETYIQSKIHTYQDYLDGVMINAYSEKESNTLKLVSRSSFDATGTFYSQRPFHDLVYEALYDQDHTVDLASWLPKYDGACSTFMSLLLQHPEHRVVNKISKPRLYLVHTGHVDNDGTVHIDEIPDHHPIPRLDGPADGQTTASWFSEQAEKRGWEWQGVVIKDGIGNRWRMRSNTYRMVRSLRGNSARTEVRFAQLLQNNLIDTYLYYYPEDREIFIRYLQRLDVLIKVLYERYVRVHITKTLSKDMLEPIWKPYIFSLHGMYLFTLKPNRQFIREKDVRIFVSSLQWQQLVHLLNYRSP